MTAAEIEEQKENREEQAYLDLCRYIIEQGEGRPDRTGTGTISVFAPPQLRFNLADNQFPLLTTKRTFVRGIIAELLWFIKGCTDNRVLQEQNVHIWDGNGSRQYLDKMGFTDRQEGDLGPIYGFQWRHFGAKYIDCNTDYSGQGVDQLAQVIEKLRNNPYDRRIIMSAWNPADMAKMALPPCHVFSQFYVNFGDGTGKPKLSCLLYQRSCDMGLGVPFNIASYALLCRMIAHVVDMDPGEFIHTMGDTHIYKDHMDGLKIQMDRRPRQFPKLIIKRSVKDIDDFQVDDFEITNYNPYPKIPMNMSV